MAVVVLSAVTGLMVMLSLSYRRWWRHRLASAEGAPPAGLNPRNHSDVGVLAWWVDEDHEYEMVDPTPEVVIDAVRALDGRGRSVVSVYSGQGRLDVGGSASGPLVVQASLNRASWSQLGREPGVVDAEVVGVAMLGYVVFFRRDRLADREGAERAVRYWLQHGERDPAQPWWKHPRHQAHEYAMRPALLQKTD